MNAANRFSSIRAMKTLRRSLPASSTFIGAVVVSNAFQKCPNCEAPFPIVVRVESDGAKEMTEIVLRLTCYQCDAHVDCTLKLGDLAEVRRNAS